MRLTFLRAIVQFIFPSHCVVCGKTPTRLHFLCADRLSPAPPNPHPWIFSLYRYADPRISALVRHLKNKEDSELCDTLGQLLAVYCNAHAPLTPTPSSIVIVPVPARKDRMVHSGFNQVELLARAVARHLPNSLLMHNLVYRSRETTKQALVHERAQRLRNLQNAFAVDMTQYYHMKKDAVIIIIDDVTTSGATLVEIRRSLHAIGASRVYAVTLAH